MKPLGEHKTHTLVEGHQNCSTCHPPQKSGRARDKKSAEKQIKNDLVDNEKTQLPTETI